MCNFTIKNLNIYYLYFMLIAIWIAMPTCSAFGCTYKRYEKNIPDRTVHRFPFSRPDILNQWIKNMRRKDFWPSHFSVLCSDHFEEECFDRNGNCVRLRKDAVPTIFNFPEYFQKELDSLKPRAELKSPYPLSVKQEPFEVISNDTDIQTALFGGSDKNRILVVPGDMDIQSTFSSSYGNTYDQNHVLIISDDTGIQTMLKTEDVDDNDDNRAIIVSDGTNMQNDWGNIGEDSFLNGMVTLDDTNIGIRSLNNCIADSSYKNPLLLHNSEFCIKRIEELEAVMAKLKKKLKVLHQTTRRNKTKITRLRTKVSRIIRNGRPLPCSTQPIVHLIAYNQ